jgi:transglutaminase-like putative cysteine protease
MHRSVTAHLQADVAAPATIALQIVPAAAEGLAVSDELVVTVDGRAAPVRQLRAQHGTPIHVVDAPAGALVVDYWADVSGRANAEAVDEADLLGYLRPSRYCESDSLGTTAGAEFAGLEGADLLSAVSSWVGTRLSYVPGSSRPTDGAVRTLLARQGVCRDYAHLVVALLRAMDLPARLVAVYAPGLEPMDFHAVAEAHVAGHWHVVDATTLAPRGSMLRISTGRDAGDTAFLSSYGGAVALGALEVSAVADVLPDDDVQDLVRLA